MKRIAILGLVLVLLASSALSAQTPKETRTKTVGKYLIAAGCAVFATSMVLMLNDQRTGYGYHQGMEVAYKEYKKPYLIGDVLGVALFSVGAILFTKDNKSLRVNASVKKKAAMVRLTYTF
jgi:hypothetical protein